MSIARQLAARMRRLWRRLLRDRRGSAAMEFGIVGTVFVLMLLGVLELGRIEAASMVLEGAAREASRYGVTGDSDPTAPPVTPAQRLAKIRNIVNAQVAGFLDATQITIDVQSYSSFSGVGVPGQATPGAGGPNDVVVYTLTYPQKVISSLIASVLNMTTVLHSARVVVRNEPY